jgi:hypothetical protein
MTFDPISHRLLITDNTTDGRLYAVDSAGTQTTLAMGISGIAGVAVRSSGQIFVSTAAFGGGAVLMVDRENGETTPVLGGLEYGAGLAFDPAGDLLVQDSYDLGGFNLRGRVQTLPITETTAGLHFEPPVFLGDGLQSRYSLAVDSEGDVFATGGGGLHELAGNPLQETPWHPSQFSAAIAISDGVFERFAGTDGARLAFAAEAEFGIEDTFITLITPAQPGDFDADGTVNAADYDVWRSAFGSTGDQAADGNSDGVVDAADYVVWRRNTSALSASSTTSAVRAVPEPSISQLVPLIGFVFIIVRSRNSYRSAF